MLEFVRRSLLLTLSFLLVSGVAWAQVRRDGRTEITGGPGLTPSDSLPIRCVTSDGKSFESCAGGGGGGVQDVNLTQYLGVAFSATNALHVRPGTSTIWDVQFVSPQAVTQSGIWNIGTLTSITNPVQVVGNIANSSIDSGNPVKIGGFASNNIPTAVDEGDRVNTWHGLNGQLIFSPVDLLGQSATNGCVGGFSCIKTTIRTGAGQEPTMSIGGGLHNTIIDSSSTNEARVLTVNPTGTEGGVVTRNIPSGTQPVSGNVTIGTFPDNEPFNLNQWAGTTPTAAAALADNTTNPTAPAVGAHLLGWDAVNTNWDRIGTNGNGNGATVTCTNCGSPATSTVINISVSETLVAPTAATWYLKRRWTVPSTFTFTPTRAMAAVATAGSQTLIGIGRALGSFNLSTNVFTDGGSVSAPNHYGRLFGCITTVQSATATTITVTYTNEAGTGGRTTVATVFAASSPVGNCFELQLSATTGQMRDNGIRDITAVSDTADPTGVVEFYGINPTLDANGGTQALDMTAEDLAVVVNPEQVFIIFKQVATTAQLRSAGLTGGIR